MLPFLKTYLKLAEKLGYITINEVDDEHPLVDNILEKLIIESGVEKHFLLDESVVSYSMNPDLHHRQDFKNFDNFLSIDNSSETITYTYTNSTTTITYTTDGTTDFRTISSTVTTTSSVPSQTFNTYTVTSSNTIFVTNTMTKSLYTVTQIDTVTFTSSGIPELYNTITEFATTTSTATNTNTHTSYVVNSITESVTSTIVTESVIFVQEQEAPAFALNKAQIYNVDRISTNTWAASPTKNNNVDGHSTNAVAESPTKSKTPKQNIAKTINMIFPVFRNIPWDMFD
jgi:hypothetical protein